MNCSSKKWHDDWFVSKNALAALMGYRELEFKQSCQLETMSENQLEIDDGLDQESSGSRGDRSEQMLKCYRGWTNDVNVGDEGRKTLDFEYEQLAKTNYWNKEKSRSWGSQNQKVSCEHTKFELVFRNPESLSRQKDIWVWSSGLEVSTGKIWA